MNKVFYKARLAMTEEGMQVVFDKYHAIHETNCYFFCVRTWNYPIPSPLKKHGESDYQTAKRIKYKIIKVQKGCSRIAFETEDDAFSNLLFLKRRQIGHMKRDLDLLQFFLERVGGKGISALDRGVRWPEIYTLPNSQEKLCEYYVFD